MGRRTGGRKVYAFSPSEGTLRALTAQACWSRTGEDIGLQLEVLTGGKQVDVVDLLAHHGTTWGVTSILWEPQCLV